jgi:hypothetical protein
VGHRKSDVAEITTGKTNSDFKETVARKRIGYFKMHDTLRAVT